MIEIIPNWHPILVHYTVALLSLAVVLMVIARFIASGPIHNTCVTVGQWNLWIGAGLTVFTVIAGWLAFNSVEHDDKAHAVMVDHRNLALTTFAIFLASAIWVWRRAQASAASPSWGVVLVLVIGLGFLGATAWHGAELVYRHGLGVISLPDTGEHSHENGGHSHDNGHNGGSAGRQSSMGAAPAASSAAPEEAATDNHTHNGDDNGHHDDGDDHEH